ncbi:transcription elongation factor B polypeptide 3-like [Lineus longissimus]|uniref:transcription elongation factor B polypeptide 3-like n=1 Tax=Lineus longissimus TaxID=88925 RepID=UPI002B4DCE92
MAQTKEAQILCMKRYLETEGINPETLLKVFKSLSKIQLTVELLQSTGIGKLVNGFRKQEGKVGERAKALVAYWKTLVSTTVTEEKKAKAEADKQAAEREATRKTDMDIVDLVNENARMAKLKQELQILKDKLKNSRHHEISESSSSDDDEVTSTTQHVSVPTSKKKRKTKTKSISKAKSRDYDDSPPRNHNDILKGLKDDDSDAEADEKEIAHQRRVAEWEAKQRAEIAKLKAEKRRIEELREQRRIAREKKISKLYENEPMLFSPDSAMTVLVKPKPKPKPIPDNVQKTKREISVSPNPNSRERTRDSSVLKNKRELSVSPNPNSRTHDSSLLKTKREMSVSPNPTSRERTHDSKHDGQHEHKHGHGHRSHDGRKSHRSNESTERKKDRSHDGRERSRDESKHHHHKSHKSRDSENERKNDSKSREHKSDKSRAFRNHGHDSDRSTDSLTREHHDTKSREQKHEHKSDQQHMEKTRNSQPVSEHKLNESKTRDEKRHVSKNHEKKHNHESHKSSSQKRSAEVSDFDMPNKKVKVENSLNDDKYSYSPLASTSLANSDAELDFSGAGIEEEWVGSDQEQKGLSFEDFLSYDARAKMKSGKSKSSSSSKAKHKSHKSHGNHGNHDKHSHGHRDKPKSEKTSKHDRHASHNRGKDSEKSTTTITSSDGNRSQDGESPDGKKFKPRRSTLTLSPLDIPQPSMKLSLSQRDILSSVSALPPTQPDYKPLHFPDMDGQSRHANKHEVEGDFLSNKKKSRTQVYSGRKTTTYLTEVPRLYDACMMVLMNHLENLECIGGVPYDIIKPVLEKCTPSQLYTLEDYNPHLVEDSDELWQTHCKKDFRKYSPEEMESWRELYLRLHDEREARLKKLTTNISASMAAKLPVRTTKLAFVDSAAKAPREVLRRQRQLGTAGPMIKNLDPLAKLSSHGGGPGKARYVKPSDHAEMFKPQKMTKQVAPMMAKTLKMMKKCKR